MGILDTLGFGRKKAAPTAELHPQAAQAWGHVLSAWLQGAAVEVLNPHTDNWEDTSEPAFDPQYQYRIKSVVTARVAPVATAARIHRPEPTPAPAPLSGGINAQRGDIFTTPAGHTFIVLADKRAVFPNYNVNIDPDHNPLVVMRYDSGIKNAVSCRNLAGGRKDGNDEFRLQTKVRHDNSIMGVDGYNHDNAGFTKIWDRTGAKDVYLDNDTFEVRFL